MAGAADGVLLAGGCSSRAGAFKMAEEVGGRPLILWGVEILASACRRVIVVAGARGERIASLVAGLPGVELALNPDFARGMLSSVQAGARRVSAGRFFVLPGDMPLVRPATLRALLAVAGDVVVPACGGRRGHPVLLGAALVPEILAEPLGSSLGNIVRRRGAVVVEVGDAGVLADADTAPDLERADAELRARGRG